MNRQRVVFAVVSTAKGKKTLSRMVPMAGVQKHEGIMTEGKDKVA
jgi:hypothetical protein